MDLIESLQAIQRMIARKMALPGCFSILYGTIALFFGYLLALVVLDWRENYLEYSRYQPATCTLLSTKIVKGGKLGGRYTPHVEYEFSVGGTRYLGHNYDDGNTHSIFRSRIETALYRQGRQRTCWYDPENPAKSVLERPFPWLYIESYVVFATTLLIIAVTLCLFVWFRSKNFLADSE